MIERSLVCIIRVIAALCCVAATLHAQDTSGTAAAPTVPVGVTPKYDHFWLPDQATKVAGQIDDMFMVILWITGVTMILVFAALIYFLIRYRARPGGKAIYNHGSTRLEIVWTVLPALIFIVLAFVSRDLWSQIKQEAPTGANTLVIDVKPRQFQWDITYAGSDEKMGTSDDIISINQLHVPADQDVMLMLTAQDVIHSFFVPEFRVKQDAVPGMTTRYWFNVPKPGMYEIACAELCGLGHYRMRGYVTVHSPADFETWYTKAKQEKANELNPPVAESVPAGDSTAASVSAADSSAAIPPAADSAAADSDTTAKP